MALHRILLSLVCIVLVMYSVACNQGIEGTYSWVSGNNDESDRGIQLHADGTFAMSSPSRALGEVVARGHYVVSGESIRFVLEPSNIPYGEGTIANGVLDYRDSRWKKQ